MTLLIDLLIWIGKSILILTIFHLLIPSVVHNHTKNSWVKLPVFIVFSFIAGIFMAWLKYVPEILLFIWLKLTHSTVEVMTEPEFENEAKFIINKPLFYWSSYIYVVLSCVLAWFLQAEVFNPAYPDGEKIMLWRQILGLH